MSKRMPTLITEYKKGWQVCTCPDARFKPMPFLDPQAKFGFIMSKQSDNAYFVRYWTKDLSELRTKANSELTEWDDMMLWKSVPKEQVETAIKWIENQDKTQ